MELQLASEPEAPGQARSAIAPLRGRVDERTLDDLRLIVSELVTNAVVHTDADSIRVRVEVDEDGRVHGEVEDHGPGGVKLRPTTPGESGGYGLELVDALTRNWGVEGHKRVWFELDGPRSSN